MFDIKGALEPINTIVNRIFDLIPDPQKKAQAQLDYQKEQDSVVTAFLASDQAQAQTNSVEAQSSNLFVSGWRPFLGWVFGSSFAWVFVVQPILMFVLKAVGHSVELPTLDLSQMTPMVTGMLGLAGMRTYERINSVQRDHL